MEYFWQKLNKHILVLILKYFTSIKISKNVSSNVLKDIVWQIVSVQNHLSHKIIYH